MNCRLRLHELKADAFMNCPAGMNCRLCLHVGVGRADGLDKYIPSVKTYGFATSPCNKGRLARVAAGASSRCGSVTLAF